MDESPKESIDWNRLLSDFQDQSIDQAFQNIMAKVKLKERKHFTFLLKNLLQKRCRLTRILNSTKSVSF